MGTCARDGVAKALQQLPFKPATLQLLASLHSTAMTVVKCLASSMDRHVFCTLFSADCGKLLSTVNKSGVAGVFETLSPGLGKLPLNQDPLSQYTPQDIIYTPQPSTAPQHDNGLSSSGGCHPAG